MGLYFASVIIGAQFVFKIAAHKNQGILIDSDKHE